MIDFCYFFMIKIMSFYKKIGIYDIRGIKGITYKLISSFISIVEKILYIGVRNSKSGVSEGQSDQNIIVSLTTFPKRINEVYLTISSLMKQDLKPHKIILWLSNEEFPNKMEELPQKLIKLTKRGLEIRFCENIKPHKKYYFALKEYPAAIIITVDDDVFYPKGVLKELMRLHKKYPNEIICTRAHKMIFSNGKIEPYNKWEDNPKGFEEPNDFLCPTGIGGVLYPSKSLSKEVFNLDNIKELCLDADDLWLKIMSFINNRAVVKSEKYPYPFLSVGRSQKHTLSKINVLNNRNDIQLQNILRRYGEEVSNLLNGKGEEE